MKTYSFLLFFLICSISVNAQQNWQLDTLQVGGIKQVIASKGNAKGPVLLLLHGGPGGSHARQADSFSAQLQQSFLVVQWDQRESGRTLALNPTKVPITLDLMVSDTRQLIEALLKKYQKQKLYLAGESWGTVLGFQMAELYPEKLHAYLAFAPVTDQVESEKRLLQLLKEEALQKNNTQAQQELGRVHIPFKNSDQIYYLRKWWFAHEGHPFPDKDTTAVKNYLKNWSDTWLKTWNAAMERNLFKVLPKLKCPVYFFIGGRDYQTNYELARTYYEKLKAPKKKLYWFEKASHDLLVTEAVQVQEIIMKEILLPDFR